MLENEGGRISTVDLTGDAGVVTPRNTRLDAPSTMAIYFGQAYIVESQVDDLLAGTSPELPFRIVRFPVTQLMGDTEVALVHDIDYLFLRNVRCPTENGRALLTRHPDSLEVDVFIEDVPNGIYTGWWIVTNKPQCLDPAAGCDPEMAVLWGSGFDVTDNTINIHNEISTGTPPGFAVPDQPFFGVTVQELTDPETAWVRYVLKYKGPAKADATELATQLNAIGGPACATDFPEVSAQLPLPYCPDKFQASFGEP